MPNNDIENLTYIRNFLTTNRIAYAEPETGIFNMTGGSGKAIQVRYANEDLKIVSKRFNIPGVSMDHCYRTTIEQEKLGVRVIWWKSFELEDRFGPSSTRKRNVIQSYILSATGKVGTRFYARECEVKEITNREAKPFLDANSFYGHRSASLTYGLFNKKPKGDIPAGTLLMVLSLGHPYYGKDLYDMEVLRSSTLLNVQVVGGSSKLMKHCFEPETIKISGKDMKWNSIVFYVDLCHNDGTSLPTLGFKFWKDSGGGLMNIDLVKGETFNRRPAQHKEIMAMMAEGRVVSAPLCGVRNYIYCKNGDYSKYGIVDALPPTYVGLVVDAPIIEGKLTTMGQPHTGL